MDSQQMRQGLTLAIGGSLSLGAVMGDSTAIGAETAGATGATPAGRIFAALTRTLDVPALVLTVACCFSERVL
jgi:hypothetical protein